MTTPRHKLIASIILIIEIVALVLMTFGLYVRFANGNPVGAMYIFVGGLLATAGTIVMLFMNRQRVN